MANNSTAWADPVRGHGFCFMLIPPFDPYDLNRPASIDPTWTFLIAVNGLAAPPTVVLNGLIIWAVLGDEHLRSSPFNDLLVALAVTDFLVGLLVEPLFCLFLGCVLNECYSPCQFTVFTLSSFICLSLTLITMTLASAERYVAIEYPNFYRAQITGKKVMIVAMILWTVTLAIVLLCYTYLNRKSHPGLFLVPYILGATFCGVIILYCSIKVQVTAYRQSRSIALQQASVQQSQQSTDEPQQPQEERFKEYKRVFVMTMLIVLSLLFYIPFIVVSAVAAVKGKHVTSDFRYLSIPVCATLIRLQSLINPIIMSLRLSRIRQGIKNKLSKVVCFCRNLLISAQ